MRHLLILLAAVAACWVCTTSSAEAQTIIERLITPGPLARAHADLEDDCNACHTSFQRAAQSSQCLDCHREIRSDIARKRKFHGRYDQARTLECRVCHTDHEGRNFQLIRFNSGRFNHNLTDYPLEGGHRGVACAACHTGRNNYRGTPTTCISCHSGDEPHRGRLGKQCQDCHQASAWKQLRPYDHRAQTGFALTGAHAQAQCSACHGNERWDGLGSECADCHRADDIHRGTRGTNCASCHRTTAWTQTTFDHDSTGFPLIGGHAAAACASCHGANNRTPKPATDCNSCHAKDDVHETGNGTDCAECHSARSWKRIQFDHNRLTEFALRGAHAKASCSDCHNQPLRVEDPPIACIGCHRKDDAHEGRNGENCSRCHSEVDWEEVDFDHGTMTDFPLLGAHASAECESCHTSPPGEVKLTGICGDCHHDDDVHAGNLGSDCANCHNSEDWATRVRFDHDLGKFPLLGAHASAECTDCHNDRTFAVSGMACADCHKDEEHKGALGTPADCQSCHNTRDWAAWSFDHDRATTFPLTGEHRGLVCSACHSRPGDPARLPGECVDCHKRDDRHRGEFGSDCARCHVTNSFKGIILPD